MSHVTIYQLQNDGSQKIIATISLRNNQISMTGSEVLLAQLERGIARYDTDTPELVFPEQGRTFLEQLQYYFKSGYLSASPVIEDDVAGQ